MTLGERLMEYRTNLKMSQDTLAEKIGVTRQTISKWETDQSTPEFNKILPLCEVFSISTDELIKGIKDEKLEKENLAKNEENEKKEIEEYNLKRNKNKAIFISISVFLYIIGAFAPAYMIEGMGESDASAVMALGAMWAIATMLLIYFFIAYPKKEITYVKNANVKAFKGNNNVIQRRVIHTVNLCFLLIYLISSFLTSAWHLTWILWIVCVLADTIVKLIFDLKMEEKNEE